MLLFLTSLTCFVLSGLQAVRTEDEKLTVGSGLPLEPFSVILTILNKHEVIERIPWVGWALDMAIPDGVLTKKVTTKLETMLPPALQDMGIQCTFKTSKIDKLTGTMVMRISNYSRGEAMRKAKGEVFAESLESIVDTLGKLGMEEKIASVDAKISAQLRAGLIAKIPEILEMKLKEQGIVVNVLTDPPAPPPDPLPEIAPSPNYKLFFHIAIRDRETLARQLDSRLLRFALRELPQAKFMDIIQRKLTQKVSEGVQNKTGKALNVTVSTQPDTDAGANNRESFWLLLQVNDIDVAGLLSSTKGPEFAESIIKLLDSLSTLQAQGLEAMGVTINNIHTMIDNQALGGLASSLPATLQKSLGADVTNVSMAVFNHLQDLATSGRCCSDGEDLYWVAQKYAKGSGLFSLGYGKKGHCPMVKVKEEIVCAAKGTETFGAVQTKYRPYTDCFSFSSDADATECTPLAIPVDSRC